MLSYKRHEWKYIISPQDHAHILSYLQFMGKKDPHSGPDGRYVVTSLYLDTPDLLTFQAKVKGLNPRHKIRWRWYGDNTSNVRLEVKKRNRDYISKLGFDLSISDIESFLKDPSKFHDKVTGDIVKFLWSHQYDEKLLIRYDRYAWMVSDYRVTYDTDIMFSPFPGKINYFPLMTDNILEFKGDGALPPELTELVSRFRLTRQSFSKYEKGVLASGIS